jgi:NAD(P)-dependent dehydrogenase (short-subunit alcohol dehydrogenase family)
MTAPVFVLFGGSRGIGEAIALAAGRQQMLVLLTYTSQAERAQGVVDRIRAAGGQAAALQADAGREADVAAVFREADRLGALSALVYNSGVTGAASPLAEAQTETIDQVLNVNLRGAVLSAREAVRRMSTRLGGQGGNIVFISSRAAFYGSANEFVWYAASKGGVDSLTSGLAREVASEGIRVNAVSPGPIATEMHRPGRLEVGAKRAPLQRAGTPEEVASTVMFLTSREASYITGANIVVAGGL